MIARLLRLALDQRFLALIAAVALVVFGVWSFTQLKIEAYPDISDTTVDVITVVPGLAAEEVEQFGGSTAVDVAGSEQEPGGATRVEVDGRRNKVLQALDHLYIHWKKPT